MEQFLTMRVHVNSIVCLFVCLFVCLLDGLFILFVSKCVSHLSVTVAHVTHVYTPVRVMEDKHTRVYTHLCK